MVSLMIQMASYALFAAILIPAALYTAGAYVDSPPGSDEVPFTSLALVFSLITIPAALLALVYVHYYRVRVDVSGILVRRLFHGAFWPWEWFEKNLAQHGSQPHCFTCISQGERRRRKLNFGFLSAEHAEYVRARCYEHWPEPKRTQLPEKVAFKTTHPFRRRHVILRQEGLVILTRKETNTFTWADVEELSILRWTRRYPGFNVLRLKVGRHRIMLTSGQGASWWKGTTPEILAGFLERHVSSERTRIHARSGPVDTVAEVDERIRALCTQRRWFLAMPVLITFMYGVTPLSPLLGVVSSQGSPFDTWQFVEFSILLGSIALIGISAFIAFRHGRQELQRTIAALDTQRQALQAEIDGHSPPKA